MSSNFIRKSVWLLPEDAKKLTEESKKTGNAESVIIRRALNEYNTRTEAETQNALLKREIIKELNRKEKPSE